MEELLSLLKLLLQDYTEITPIALAILKIILQGMQSTTNLLVTHVPFIALGKQEQSFKKHHEILLFDLIPGLSWLSENSQDKQVQILANELNLHIQFHKVAIEPPDNNCSKSGSSPYIFDIKDLLADIQAPLLSTRVHGIIQLRKAVLSKSLNENQFTEALKIFASQLQNEESYVYLNAIQGLGALADIYPDKTIPFLVTNYNSEKLSELAILKVGEVIVQVCVRLGEAIPKYSMCFFILR